MLRIFAVCTALLAFAGPAAADDFYWTGFHAGVISGAWLGQNSQNVVGPFASDASTNTGFLLGVEAGADMQMEKVVFGLSIDAAYLPGGGVVPCTSNSYAANSGCRVDVDQLMTFRARVGSPIGKFLPYASGGLAVGHVISKVVLDHLSDGWPIKDNRYVLGATGGAGIEMAVTENVRAKVEYLYTWFPTFEATAELGTVRSISASTHQIRVGLDVGF